MMQILGYHNHNNFCDGEKNLDEYLQEAVKQRFTAFGFSSHAPFNFFNKWSISVKNLNKYSSEIDFYKTKYETNFDLWKALEIDYAPGFIENFDFFREKYRLDYVIGSIHYVVHPRNKKLLFIDGDKERFKAGVHKIFGGDIRYAVESYFAQTMEMICTQKPDIAGHIDKIIMNASDSILINGNYPPWYENLVKQVVNEAVSNKVIIELNMRGLIKNKWHSSFIDEYFLPYCNKQGAKFVVSTDAHKPQEIALFYEKGLQMLSAAGIKTLMRFTGNKWTEEPF